MHSWIDAYKGRRLKKRNMRRLWITRINAGARINGVSYSRMMGGLRRANVEIDRKILADIAVADPEGFATIVNIAKTAK